MARVIVSKTYEEPVDKVWSILADHGNVASFHPGIVESRYLNKKKGKGGKRACEFGGGKGVDEVVTEWQKHEAMTFTGTAFRKLPMKKMVGHFRFEGTGPTTVTFEMEYAMKGGIVMDFMAKGMMRKAGIGMLDGLQTKL